MKRRHLFLKVSLASIAVVVLAIWVTLHCYGIYCLPGFSEMVGRHGRGCCPKDAICD